MIEKPTYSFSRCDTYQRCSKKWFWEYYENLAPKAKAEPLQIGILIHAFRDLYTQQLLTLEHITKMPECIQEMFPQNSLQETEMIASEVARLFRGYIQKWEASDYKIVSPEMHLVWEGPEFNIYARLDALAEDTLGRWRLECKTTSRMDNQFLKGMFTGLQTAISHWLIQQLMPKMKVRGSLFDLIVKTQTPQYARQPVMIPQWKIDASYECICGIHNDIKNGRAYRSLDCEKYNKDCEYMILCRDDSQYNRETFYEQRKEAMDREKAVMKKFFGV